MCNASFNAMASFTSIGLLLTVLALASARIVQKGQGYGSMGGVYANITELPYQVFIREKGGIIQCGGSIISPQHILTSSYWVPESEDKYEVVAATADRLSGGDVYSVARITRHPDKKIYLAVIKLTKEINLSDKAKPIALAGPKYTLKDGTEVIASGWGGSYNLVLSDKLQKLIIAKISDEECKDNNGDIDIAENFCAGGMGKRVCGFDQGGPLITKTSKGNLLVGVTRYLINCQYTDFHDRPYSLFTKVAPSYKWIKEVVDKDLESN